MVLAASAVAMVVAPILLWMRMRMLLWMREGDIRFRLLGMGVRSAVLRLLGMGVRSAVLSLLQVAVLRC